MVAVLGAQSVCLAQVAPQVTLRSVVAADKTNVTYLFLGPSAGGTKVRSVVALAPGSGDESMGRTVLERYFASEAMRRGWSVSVPVVPASEAGKAGYFRRRPDLVVAVADDVANLLKIDGGSHLLAGVSNGGLDAFAVAVVAPGRFGSITVLPGALDAEITDEELTQLKGKPITIVVGEKDGSWRAAAESARKRLEAAGAAVVVRSIASGEHVLRLESRALMDVLGGDQRAATLDGLLMNTGGSIAGWTQEAAEVGKERRDPPVALDVKERAIAGVLEDFHDAAAKADEERYFQHFTPDAVFLGTDATERWTYAQFRAWAKPQFANGKGWTYFARDRHIFISPNGDCAWFDEMLDNKKLGECRGSGVLVRIDGVWRIAQYHLVLPVPNDLADELVRRGRELAEDRK